MRGGGGGGGERERERERERGNRQMDKENKMFNLERKVSWRVCVVWVLVIFEKNFPLLIDL